VSGDDDVAEVVVLAPGRELVVRRPRDPEALIDDRAFADDEFLPYWAELWPSGVGLARAIADRAWGGAPVVELGCGLGLPAVTAALGGARVLATDWSADALLATERTAADNGAVLETLRVDWADPAALIARGPFRSVLAADVLYEARNIPPLLALIPQLLAPGGEVWLADPGRAGAEAFLEGMRAGWDRRTTVARDLPSVSIHRMRPVPSQP
jgi:predicted nicotinamide N-methyase